MDIKPGSYFLWHHQNGERKIVRIVHNKNDDSFNPDITVDEIYDLTRCCKISNRFTTQKIHLEKELTAHEAGVLIDDQIRFVNIAERELQEIEHFNKDNYPQMCIDDLIDLHFELEKYNKKMKSKPKTKRGVK